MELHRAWGRVPLFEGYSWRISRRELMKHSSWGESAWQRALRSKDPTIFTVFLEDTAALIAIGIALVGIFLGHLLRNPYFDPAASIRIAVLLVAIGVLLGRESGALLIGERARPPKVKRMREIIRSDKAVEDVGDLLTMHLGPDQVLLAVDIKFRGGLNVRELEAATDRIEQRIRKEDPTVQRIFIEADSLLGSARKKAA